MQQSKAYAFEARFFILSNKNRYTVFLRWSNDYIVFFFYTYDKMGRFSKEMEVKSEVI